MQPAMILNFSSLPLNVAVLIVNYLDQSEMRPLFQTCQRWRRIGDSDGVALHLLQLYGLLEPSPTTTKQKTQKTNSSDADVDDDDVVNQNMTSLATLSNKNRHRNFDEQNPRSILINDPDFGSRNPNLVACFSKILLRFKQVCNEKLYFDEDVVKAGFSTFLGNGYKNHDRDIVDDIVKKYRNELVSDPSSSQQRGEDGDDDDYDDEKKERRRLVEGWNNPLRFPLELRLWFRLIGSVPSFGLFCPFGVTKFYSEVETINFLPLRTILAVFTLRSRGFGREFKGGKQISVPFATFGNRHFLHIVTKEATTNNNKKTSKNAEKEHDEEGAQDDGDDDADDDSDFRPRLPFKTGAVIAVGAQGYPIPISPSFADFFNYFVKGYETGSLRCTKWPVTYEELGLSASDIIPEFDDLQHQQAIARVLRKNARVPCAFPTAVTFSSSEHDEQTSSSSSMRNYSIARTSTVAGDIIVQMSANLLAGRTRVYLSQNIRNNNISDNGTESSSSSSSSSSSLFGDNSVFFFAYRCRMWRETTTTTSNGGESEGEDEVERQQKRLLPVLRMRRWRIFHTKAELENGTPSDSVEGDGVIGLYPRFLPLSEELRNNHNLREENAVWDDSEPIDGVFEYCSGTTMKSPFGGSMEGEFLFEFVDTENSSSSSTYPPVWVKVGNFSCEFGNYKNQGVPYLFY